MSDPEATQLKKITRHMHRAVWGEYFAWETSMCSSALQGLRKNALFQQETEDFLESEGTHATSSDRLNHVLPESVVVPTDPYESCLPAYRQILYGDDPDDMPFLPYADDTSFNSAGYIAEHNRFAWQTYELKTDGE